MSIPVDLPVSDQTVRNVEEEHRHDEAAVPKNVVHLNGTLLGTGYADDLLGRAFCLRPIVAVLRIRPIRRRRSIGSASHFAQSSRFPNQSRCLDVFCCAGPSKQSTMKVLVAVNR